ncbi:MAG: type II toxin-antitoxin system VapC family toxin, partial [Moorellaceae bacterium]
AGAAEWIALPGSRGIFKVHQNQLSANNKDTERPSVYLETTIPSYLAARQSRDIVVAAHQQITREWWTAERKRFRLFVSEAVISECSSGDTEAAARRLSYIEGLPVLAITDSVFKLAKLYLATMLIPLRSEVDALHLACAVIHEMDYLLTWNCKHLAHGEIR